MRLLGDIELEGGIAALVRAGTRAVDPDGGGVVDRTEVENPALRCAGREQLEVARIPADAEEAGLSDPAGRGFRRERRWLNRSSMRARSRDASAG